MQLPDKMETIKDISGSEDFCNNCRIGIYKTCFICFKAAVFDKTIEAIKPQISQLESNVAELESENKLLREALKPSCALRPVVVCLCGSTRFSEAFRSANLQETLKGNIVLSIGCDFKSDDALGLTYVDKERLDELHKRKIDLADEVLILNVGGYIGKSTQSELEYAITHNKKIRYLETTAHEAMEG